MFQALPCFFHVARATHIVSAPNRLTMGRSRASSASKLTKCVSLKGLYKFALIVSNRI